MKVFVLVFLVFGGKHDVDVFSTFTMAFNSLYLKMFSLPIQCIPSSFHLASVFFPPRHPVFNFLYQRRVFVRPIGSD